MAGQPLVSVIIPTYNAITTIANTLESVRHQTYRLFEIIVVDDGSTDDTLAYLKTQPDIKLIQQSNHGVSAARNHGAQIAVGKYLAFLDSDDLWHPQKLDLQIQVINKIGQFGLLGTRVSSNQNALLKQKFAKYSRTPTWRQYDFYAVLRNARCLPSTVIIPADIFRESGGFQTDLVSAEDRDLWLRIVYHYPFYVISWPLAVYNIRPNSLSREKRWTGLVQIPLIIEKWDPLNAFNLDNDHRIVPSKYQPIARHIIYLHGREILKYYDRLHFDKYWQRFGPTFTRFNSLVRLFIILRYHLKYCLRRVKKRPISPEMLALLEDD